jgi:diguanylate cyclase (GGDEF)-like protein
LIGVYGTKVGMLALDIKVNPDELDKLELLVDTIGAYLHNQLLMKQLDLSANTDPLTGIYNRRYFEKVFDEEAKRFKQYGINFAVLTLDVNLLKKANDNHGHEVGDILLKKVAALLLSAVRPSDIVARVGGDEFAILLSDTDQKSAEDLCNRLTGKVFNDVYVDSHGAGGFPVTVSVGYAGTDLCAVTELIGRADERMYENKEQFYNDQKKHR